MRLFECHNCGQVLYFENTRCERCGYRLGYVPERTELAALRSEGDLWCPVAEPGERLRFCDNARFEACNWMLSGASTERMCVACRHNRTIPDLSVPGNLALWRRLEVAKHRLLYSLLRLGLPLANRADDPAHGLAFDLLADAPDLPGGRATTGHQSGVVTIALREANDAERERERAEMGEPYRTLLGHFRHEVGHHYWDVLVRDGGRLGAFRALFGDERRDYGEALQSHYRNGPPPDWQEQYVSAYASAHPWEDWAETWAHYLHMVDTLEMAANFGVSVHPRVTVAPWLAAEVDFDPYGAAEVGQIVNAWLPLTFALNGLNRSMGHPDLYPFVLSPAVIDKLGFVHRLVRLA